MSGEVIRSLGAFLTGIGALLAGLAAWKRAKAEGRKECEEEHGIVPAPPD